MIIVAGIARSGMTMTMQMLDAGDYPCVGEYPAFEKYHFGQVPWSACKGQAVKLVDAHLQIPRKLKNQKVITLKRDLRQQSKSFNKFIGYMAGRPPTSEMALVRSYKHDYAIIEKWLKRQRVLRLNFEDVIKDPRTAAKRIAEFSGKDLKIDKMAGAVISRSPDCHKDLLEAGMI